MEVDDVVIAGVAGPGTSMAARLALARLRRPRTGQLGLLCLVLGAGALGLLAGPVVADAATVYVQSSGGSDLNPCSEMQPCASIHHAVEVASEGETVSVGPGRFDEEGSKEVILSKSLKIEGSPGAGATIVQGGASSAAFAVSGSHEVSLTHLTIQDPASAGVGVKNNGGRVTIAESIVSDSTSTGIENGTGASTAVTISDSTIAHNAVGVANYAAATITDSTIAENTSTGVYAFAATTTILNSTIANNAGYGVQTEGGASATLAGSILAGNAKGDCATAVTDAGYNIASDESCGLSASTSISRSSSIDLGVLAQNGGPSETELPGTESAAFEKIPAGASATIASRSAALCEGTTDQRGVARPKLAGGRCTIGAVEPASFTRHVA
ncbi:MAG: right-handed parallel beta-helix repeat-containing protein, partial [Solirubrobacteraceae bacterium]